MLKKRTFILVVILSLFILLQKRNTSAQTQANIGSWQESAVLPTATHPLPSLLAGDYYYVFLTDSRIVYAKIQNNGSLGPWQTATVHHGETAGRGFTGVVINNTPYDLRYGRSEKYIVDPATGNLTEIQQVGPDNRIGDNWYYWNSAVTANFGTGSYVFSFGGFDCCQDPHYSTNNRIFRSAANTTPWQWTEINIAKPYGNPYKAAFSQPSGQNYGFIYISDLSEEAKPNPLYRIKVNADGNFSGGFENSGPLPNKDPADANSMGDIFTANNTLFIIRGRKVYSAVIESGNGSLGAWNDSPADLPNQQINKNWSPSAGTDHTDGVSAGIKGNYVYVTGNDRVYYARLDGSNVPTITVSQTITPSPTPTFTPCSLPDDSPIKFKVTVDRISNIDSFNNSGGLKITGLNHTNRCYKKIETISAVTTGNNQLATQNTVSLPSGDYTFFVWAPRHLARKFENIKLTAGSNLDCVLNSGGNCGNLGQADKIIYSGDINGDGAVNTIDYEFYRQKVGSTATGNNADLDFNGQVEYKGGSNDDFELLKNNFGKNSDY